MKTGTLGGAAGYSMADAYAAKDVVCSVIADGVRCVSGQRKTEIHQPDAKLKAIASQGSVIWAGGDVLLRSDDGGVTWKEVKKPFKDAITQIVVMDDAVYVRTNDGTMWKTVDGGATWSQTQATK
jgi:photosystem II stability/assembly factor-like uncharacterized protein